MTNKMFDESTVKAAIELLRDYCASHTNCEDCIFKKNCDAMYEGGNTPSIWEVDE